LNIILVTGAHARARILTLDWRHWLMGGLGLATLFVLFTFAFNFVTLRWAAAVQHPWLQAIVLADQRDQMQRVQERVQGHLAAMAMRLGELQAQMLRLDSLGERLAQSAGLKPQELKALEAEPARGGAESSRVPARNLTLLEFTEMLDRLARQVDARTDQLNVLEALLLQNTTSQRFLPTLRPILDGWFSSNFGFRIDPFTGQRAYHDGIDFPAERGTPIQAAASGKVVFAGTQPEYGKMVDIDHGNGLVTRYAHASRLLVKEGDVVVAGQPIAAVGSTGRSTGPHLHFEVRQNGAPQNPARFLHAAR
jgi:murein DD-endopeptidase MepM/ murein hydrolase activator NlpD